jgi:hypothetical protein
MRSMSRRPERRQLPKANAKHSSAMASIAARAAKKTHSFCSNSMFIFVSPGNARVPANRRYPGIEQETCHRCRDRPAEGAPAQGLIRAV